MTDWARFAPGSTFDRLRHSPNVTRVTRLLPASMPALAVGITAALLILGVDGIDPGNVGWAGDGDSATHYLGWRFFRNAAWALPLGANPDYGLEIGSSIFYSDSIPLFAFLFKPFSAWLPGTFQYLGLWTAVCCVLQAHFAWLLLGYVPELRSQWPRALGCGLFVFSPVLMIRISGHSALVAQWLILAALCLCLQPASSRRRYAWPALVLATTLVHSYLFVMVLALWAADTARRALAREVRAAVLLQDGAIVLALAGLGLWQAGFFMLRVSSSGEFGAHKMNLLALVNPDIYSHVLQPVAPPYLGFHEGFNFLGLGCLLLALFNLPAVIARPALLRVPARYWPLGVVLLALAAFAVTNQVSIGSFTLTVPLPAALLDALGVLRSSGRMFWPAYYVIVFGLVLLSVRGQGQRLGSGLLALALLVQVVDTSEGWTKHRAHFEQARAATWQGPFLSEFWQIAGRTYRRLRSVPLVHHAPDYAARADYAANHGMATDSAYLARVDPLKLEAAALASENAISSGVLERDTLYLLDKAHLAAAARNLDANADLLALVDGFYVLAPGWKDRTSELEQIGAHELRREDLVALKLGVALPFGAGAQGVAYLGEGWSAPEAWGVWSDGARAFLSLPIAGHALPLQLELEAGALVAPGHPTQEVECYAGGTLLGSLHFDQSSNTRWHTLVIQAFPGQAKLDTLQLEFRLPDHVSPERLGLSDDKRELGLALHQLKLMPPP